MAQSVQIKKVSWWHERLADALIAFPEKRLTDIAKMMNCSLPWLSIVKNSDVFKDYWTLRSEAHSEAVTAGIKEKSFAVAEMCLENLSEKVAERMDAGIMTISESLDVFDTMLKRFGPAAGGPGTAPVNLNLNLGLVTQEQLASAREKMRKVVDIEPVQQLEASAEAEASLKKVG